MQERPSVTMTQQTQQARAKYLNTCVLSLSTLLSRPLLLQVTCVFVQFQDLAFWNDHFAQTHKTWQCRDETEGVSLSWQHANLHMSRSQWDFLYLFCSLGPVGHQDAPTEQVLMNIADIWCTSCLGLCRQLCCSDSQITLNLFQLDSTFKNKGSWPKVLSSWGKWVKYHPGCRYAC